MDPFTHDAYKEVYIEDEEFKEVFLATTWPNSCQRR
jgi:hypothetical protein